MFCMQCGAKLRDDAKFCAACGAPVTPRGDASAEALVEDPVSSETDDVAEEPASASDSVPPTVVMPQAVISEPDLVSELLEQSDVPVESEPQVQQQPKPVSDAVQVTMAAPTATPLPSPEPANESVLIEEQNPDDGDRGPHKRKKRMGTGAKVAIGITVVAVLAVGGGAGYYFGIYKPEQERLAQEAYDAAHSMHAVTIAVKAEGWDTTAGATRLPVHVVGADLDGNDVDAVQYVDSTGAGISLMQGSYELTVPASPIAADGTVYTVPDATVEVSIDSDAKKDQPYDISTDHGFELAPTDPAQVTDDQIKSAYDYASKDEEQDSSALDSLKDAATAKRDEAVAAAARHVVVKGGAYQYEFDLPAVWDGRVTVNQDGQGTVHVYSTKFPDYEVFSLFLYDSSQRSVAGTTNPYEQNIVTSIQSPVSSALTAVNYGNVQASINVLKESVGSSVSAITTDEGQYRILPDDACAELIDLQTGGQRTLADFQAAANKSGVGKALLTAPLDYLSQAIVPTIKIMSGQ